MICVWLRLQSVGLLLIILRVGLLVVGHAVGVCAGHALFLRLSWSRVLGWRLGLGDGVGMVVRGTLRRGGKVILIRKRRHFGWSMVGSLAKTRHKLIVVVKRAQTSVLLSVKQVRARHGAEAKIL